MQFTSEENTEELIISKVQHYRPGPKKFCYLCSLKGDVLNVLKRGECIKRIGEENIFRSKIEAIEKIVPQLDPERCRVCNVRIFNECAQMPGAKP